MPDTQRDHVNRTDGLRRRFLTFVVASLAVIAPGLADARSPAADAKAAIDAFSRNCFSPRLTADKATEVFNVANIRYDFYDLDPFTSATSSPVLGRAETPGTDRRCEVAFNGDFAHHAVTTVVARLLSEGIRTPADIPATHEKLRTSGTALLAARRLNPRKIAVVHVGTRPGTNGVETFLNVERLKSPQ